MAESKPRIDPKHVIFCDDVRREDNGKELLVGVYSGNITVPFLPLNLSLSFWMAYSTNGTGQIPFQFRLVGPHEVQFSHGSGTLILGEQLAPMASLAIGGLLVPMQVPGEIRLDFKQHADDWKTIGRTLVQILPQAPTFAPGMTGMGTSPQQPPAHKERAKRGKR